MRPEPGRRLHVESLAGVDAGADVELSKSTRQHAKVLRIRDGATIELFDGQGRLATAQMSVKSARIQEVVQKPAPLRRLGLLQGLPKGAKSDDIVRMATELGATNILFVHTERSGARADNSEKKRERWKRIAMEATRQCERLYFPKIALRASLDEAIGELPAASARYYAWARLQSGGTRLGHDETQDVWVAVGPEGGFADHERVALEGAGFQPMSLGAHILRVDTAACAALSVLGRNF
ncbi:MAG: 16S rRNA (uracil(1498)-N(3))-methyltransferase [Polyangiales bacterium]